MEYEYDERYCWHDNAEVNEGYDDYEPEGKQNYSFFHCRDCGLTQNREW